MIKIGYIDDDKEMYNDYKKRLGRADIDLIFAEGVKTVENIIDWILANELKCVVVDYKLSGRYDFPGTELVDKLNEKLPFLSCMILTSYPEDSENENLVMKNLIIDKGELSKPDISYFLSVLKQAVEVTDKKLELTKNRFFELNDKKKSENLSIYEEEEYLHLYRQLRTIGEVDDIPVQLLNSDIDGKLDNLLYQLDQLIGE